MVVRIVNALRDLLVWHSQQVSDYGMALPCRGYNIPPNEVWPTFIGLFCPISTVIKPNLFNHATLAYDRWVMDGHQLSSRAGWNDKLGLGLSRFDRSCARKRSFRALIPPYFGSSTSTDSTSPAWNACGEE